VGGGAGRHEQIQVGERGGPQLRPSLLRRLSQLVDRLIGTVVARPRHPGRDLVPELPDRALLADDHARAPAQRRHREGAAAMAGRDEVRADVAERRQPPVPGEGAEVAEAAPGHVLEEDALDRVGGAEVQNLL
jgi:hypothetical protein